MEKYKISSVDKLTPDLIFTLINRFKLKEIKRIEKLNNYYRGQSDIKNRIMTDPAKPNNKLSTGYASYITDTIEGYFLGKAIGYTSLDSILIEQIQDVFNQNREHNINTKIGKSMSVTGVGYELLYIDELNNIRFNNIDSDQTFLIYDDSIQENVLGAVRFYTVNEYIDETVTLKVELYTKDSIHYYIQDEDNLQLVDEELHYFGEVPVIQYRNNDDFMGDFEKVKDLIDAYESAISNTADNLDFFADSYLLLSGDGMDTLESEDIAKMKEQRVMLLGSGGRAEWLTKTATNMEVEEHKKRLKEDIHNMSQVPNLNDDAFGTATSGESLKYKLNGLENIVSIKERNFKTGLEQRIKLITNIFKIKGQDLDSNAITIAFTRNIPVNHTTLIDMLVKLSSMVSDKTLLSQIPFIEDVDRELKLIEEQNMDKTYSNVFEEDTVPATTNEDEKTITD